MNTINSSCDTNNISTTPVTIYLDGFAFSQSTSGTTTADITYVEITGWIDLRDWTELRVTASMTGAVGGHLGQIEIMYSVNGGTTGPDGTSPTHLASVTGSDKTCDFVWKTGIPPFIRFFNRYSGGSGVQGDLSEAKQIKMHLIGRKKIKNNSYIVTDMPTFNMNSGNGAIFPTDRIYSL